MVTLHPDRTVSQQAGERRSLYLEAGGWEREDADGGQVQAAQGQVAGKRRSVHHPAPPRLHGGVEFDL